jgi:adenylate cyclase
MKDPKPTIVLAPSLVLVLAAAAEGWNLAGLRAYLAARLFAFWENNGSVASGLARANWARPDWALPAETLALLAGGGLAILLMLRLRPYWAGLFVATLLAAGLELSWALFATRHWLIDAATPGLGLMAVFLTGAIARAMARQALRTRLRIAFSDCLAPRTLEKIVRHPELIDFDGQSRNVTYLVCGLGQLATHHRDDPQSFTHRMNAILGPLLEQARAQGGTIDRLTAEGFAAYWNAPLDDPDHALHACRAAGAMTALQTDRDNTAPQIAIGIATGDMIAGGLGLGYGVHGDARTLAARLQTLSPHYGASVIVSEETRQAAERGFGFLEVDYIAASQEDAPARLYALQANPVARASPKFRAISTFHDHIFRALRGRQWAEARSLIEQCRKLSGASQALYDLYLARIRYFERNPPAANWDGAFRPILK